MLLAFESKGTDVVIRSSRSEGCSPSNRTASSCRSASSRRRSARRPCGPASFREPPSSTGCVRTGRRASSRSSRPADTARRRFSRNGPRATTAPLPGSRSTGATTTLSCSCGTSSQRWQPSCPVRRRLLDTLAAAEPSIWTSMVPQLEALVAAAERLCARGRRPARRATEPDSTEVLAIVAEHVPAGSALVLSARTECDLTTKLRSARRLARDRLRRPRADAPRSGVAVARRRSEASRTRLSQT